MRTHPSRSPNPARPVHPGAKTLALLAVVALSLSLVDGLQGAIAGHVDSAYSTGTTNDDANASPSGDATAVDPANPASRDGRDDAPLPPPF